MAKHGSFVGELYWDRDEFIPRGTYDRVIQGYFHSRAYRKSCQYIAAVIDYRERKIELLFVPDSVTPIPEMSGNEVTYGDRFLDLYYTPAKWNKFVEKYGTFEDMKERIPGMGIEPINVPAGSTNAITYNNIGEGNRLVNFRGNAPNSFESGFGRYYKNITVQGLQGRHPMTRGQILNRRTRRAHIVPAAVAPPAPGVPAAVAPPAPGVPAARRRRGRKTRRSVNRK